MKRISHAALGLFAGFLICVPSFAGQATLIYGLDHAVQVQGNTKQQYYIRAGSFKNKANAKQFQKTLRAKINYPVKYSYQNHFYIITIGPLPSAAKVREVAHQIGVPAVKPLAKADPVAKLTATETEQVQLPEPLKPVTDVAPKPMLPVKAAPIEMNAEVKPVHAPKHVMSEHHEVYKDQIKNLLSDHLSDGKFVVTAGFGEQWPQFNSSMYVNNNSGASPPYDRDLYTTTQNMQPLVLASLAYRVNRDTNWLSAYSLGAQYQHNFSANVGNKVLQYSDPTFYNYNYSWNVASDIFMLVGKLNVCEYGFVSPYVHAGLGISFNNASNYSESPTAGVTAVRENPAFASFTATQFAYSAGVGIDFNVAKNAIVSVQYQYQNLGTVQSDKGENGWSAQSLNLGTYSTNAVLLSVSYLMDNPF